MYQSFEAYQRAGNHFWQAMIGQKISWIRVLWINTLDDAQTNNVTGNYVSLVNVTPSTLRGYAAKIIIFNVSESI